MTDAANPTTYIRPRTRQRVHKAPQSLEVPDIEDDAPERKRVLNVLAQRRYRERKRQNRLAKQKQGAAGSESQVSQTVPDRPALPVSEAVNPIAGHADDILPFTGDAGDASAAVVSLDAAVAWPGDLSDGTAMTDFMFMPMLDHGMSGDAAVADSYSSRSTIDPASLTTSSSSSPSPDSYLLPMSDLKVLNGLLRIATRLGSYSVMWDPAANSPFNQGAGTPSALLPETWRPTATQALTPHHPIMDFLPWPEVRDRIISLFSLPDAARPPAARGPLGLVNFAYDLEDSSEGARIWGADPYDASSWEVGQVLFQRWWFVFDRGVIEQSNKWRELRGAAALHMQPGSIVDDLSDSS
ncbi:hypothetical protein CkaCkLH20_12147 [Colletotrichum karsti]|uniref:BZIP domain-containing protein n=1 Tax=Colletotrichum karsti TaxID=1095194 RepID=A0A9P6LF85_9PEZI|nr:uncharacterized protein CkaCkLH20_12147 [Colletotrichum karsti]KAF9870300.1 hypothetical protein CkaCkLH20_12147 [Colletotrichum karsti]